MLFVWYPGCISCQKAKKWLDSHSLTYEARHVRDNPPTEAELRAWHALSGLPLKRFFNTSGKLYAAQGLKDRLPLMTEDEQYALLATDGMLIKRPLLITADRVLVGFREAEWEALIG